MDLLNLEYFSFRMKLIFILFKKRFLIVYHVSFNINKFFVKKKVIKARKILELR